MARKKREVDFGFTRKEEKEAMEINFKDAFLLANGKTALSEFVPPVLEGFTESELNEFKAPFERARDAGMKLVIQSDFDADGITSAALFMTAMKPHFNDIVLLQNSKLKDGYNPIVKRIIKEGGENTFLVFLDSGIAMPKSDIDVLKENFTEICIIDHHEPQSYIPEVNIVDMKLTRELGFRDLCTAGMVYTIAHQLFDGEMDDILAPVAALGTIADMVPLIDDNAHIALKGYRVIEKNIANDARNKTTKLWHEIKKEKYLGEKFILSGNFDTWTFKGKEYSRQNVTPVSYTDMGFTLAPALNATSRMKGDARIGVNALLGDVEQINETKYLNELRKNLTNEAKENVEIIENDNIRVCFIDEEYKTINGLLANKLYKDDKVIVVFAQKSDGAFTGSLRSPNKGKSCLDLVIALKESEFNFNGGGHQPAAGINVSDISKDELTNVLFELSKMYEGILPEDKRVFDISFTEEDMAFLFSKFTSIPMGIGIENPIFKYDTRELNDMYTKFKNLRAEYDNLFNDIHSMPELDKDKYIKQVKELGFNISDKNWVTAKIPSLPNIKLLMEFEDFIQFLDDEEAKLSPSYFNGQLQFNLQKG